MVSWQRKTTLSNHNYFPIHKGAPTMKSYTKTLILLTAGIMATTTTAALPAHISAATVSSSLSTKSSPAFSYNTKTNTLTIKGKITKSDVENIQKHKKTTEKIVIKSGTVFPDDSRKLFCSFKKLVSIDLSNADTSHVTNMYGMFMDCKSLKTVNMSGIDTSNITDMKAMFIRCESLENIDLSHIDTSALIGVESMFEDCVSLTTLDLSSFNTSNIEYWSSMFKGCSALQTIYVSDKWTGVKDTYVTTWLTEPIFEGCVSLKGGNGTKYAADVTDDKLYARVDKKDAPGYLTYKEQDTNTDTDEDNTIEYIDLDEKFWRI